MLGRGQLTSVCKCFLEALVTFRLQVQGQGTSASGLIPTQKVVSEKGNCSASQAQSTPVWAWTTQARATPVCFCVLGTRERGCLERERRVETPGAWTGRGCWWVNIPGLRGEAEGDGAEGLVGK